MIFTRVHYVRNSWEQVWNNSFEWFVNAQRRREATLITQVSGMFIVQCSCDYEKVKKVTLGNEWIDFFILKNWLVQWLKDLCYLEERVCSTFPIFTWRWVAYIQKTLGGVAKMWKGLEYRRIYIAQRGCSRQALWCLLYNPEFNPFSLSLSFSVWCNKKPRKYFSGGTQFICVFTIFGFFLRKEDIDATTAVQQFSLLSFFFPQVKKKFVISPSLDGVRFSFFLF